MFKKFKFNDCTSSKIVVKRLLSCYQKKCSKAKTNLGVWLKQIECKSCSAIVKLIALLFVYVRQLLYTHTHTICAQEMYYKVTLLGPQHDKSPSKFWGMNNHELETHTHTHTSCQKTHKSQNRLKWEHSSINDGSFFAYY